MSGPAFVRCMPSSFMHSYAYDLRPSDGLSLEDDPRHIILAERSGTCTLILDSLSAQDSGQYACFAHSLMGSAGTLAKVVVQGTFTSSGSFHFRFCLLVTAVYCDSSNFHNCFTLIMAAGLTAHPTPPAPPRFVSRLESACLIEGEDIQFSCSTVTTPLPRIR